VQFGIFLPRFSIHSWNDDGTANEPWMYPELTPHIRALIKFRQKLIPYFYDLLWRYHDRYEPIIRPTFHDFPDDPRCFAENDEMLLGANLLVAPVVEQGAPVRLVYLPSGADWYDLWSGDCFAGGQAVALPAPADRPPLLARRVGDPAEPGGAAFQPPGGRTRVRGVPASGRGALHPGMLRG
jgi:alpha-glucosidase